MFCSVLMLCFGNICRSPVAEGLLKKISLIHKMDLIVSSAGIYHGTANQPAQPHSITVAREHGIDIRQHRARVLNHDIIHQHELILVADEEIKKITIHQYPSASGKIKRMGHFRDQDIEDPYQKSKKEFDIMFNNIDTCLKDWLKNVWKIS